MTRKLYQKDVYMQECLSTITSIKSTHLSSSQGYEYTITMDKTVFFPTGGGQPCDLGTINGFPVISVEEVHDEVFHVLVADSLDWKIGDTVSCKIDWDRRFKHMQNHCGEHILSGIFFQECGGVNCGFHMGKDYMTIDIDQKNLSPELISKVEKKANKVIWDNVPVSVRYFDTAQEVADLPLRKALLLEDSISIVCVGDENNPADCVACCGTHPKTSGEVGLIKILKVENYKGMSRIYFKAGEDALIDYQSKTSLITSLCQHFSSEENSLHRRVLEQESKLKDTKGSLNKLQDSYLELFFSQQSIKESKVIVAEFSFIGASQIQKCVQNVLHENKSSQLILSLSVIDTTIIAMSDGKGDFNCSHIAKMLTEKFQCRGGGNENLARIKFESDVDAKTALNYCKELLVD